MAAPLPPDPTAQRLAGAMRRFASSVTVISARGADGQRTAMTATSPRSVSMAPPSMLFCMHRGGSLDAMLVDRAQYCINILASTQEAVARLCSSRSSGEERFAVGDWRESEAGVPYLVDAEAAIICTLAQRTSFGSHDIVIGLVEAVHLADPGEPLLYFDGRYAALPAAFCA